MFKEILLKNIDVPVITQTTENSPPKFTKEDNQENSQDDEEKNDWDSNNRISLPDAIDQIVKTNHKAIEELLCEKEISDLKDCESNLSTKNEDEKKGPIVGRPRKTQTTVCPRCNKQFPKPCIYLQHLRWGRFECELVNDLKVVGKNFIC
jgi:hypothetical protein